MKNIKVDNADVPNYESLREWQRFVEDYIATFGEDALFTITPNNFEGLDYTIEIK